MKLLVDMNLSPAWCAALRACGHDADHWSTLGDPGASDAELLRFASAHGYVVFTHDLDFGALLAAGGRSGPSVLQLRVQDVLPEAHVGLVARVLEATREALESGALVTIDARGVRGVRTRVLPLRR